MEGFPNYGITWPQQHFMQPSGATSGHTADYSVLRKVFESAGRLIFSIKSLNLPFLQILENAELVVLESLLYRYQLRECSGFKTMQIQSVVVGRKEYISYL